MLFLLLILIYNYTERIDYPSDCRSTVLDTSEGAADHYNRNK